MSAQPEPSHPRKPVRRRFKRLRIAVSLPAKALYSFGIRSTKSLCLPDFLIIGAAKAGTTWLHENLDCHPQVYVARRPGMHDPTEVRYFTQSFRLPLTYYSNLFLPGKDKIKGDKSPGYCTLSAFRIRFIRSIMPSVRLIYFMRNPVERAWSHALMNLVRFDGKKVEEVLPSKFYDHFVRSKEHGLYGATVDRWLRVFPEEQLYFGLYEDIASDPIRVLRDVCEHIRANTDVDWERFPYRRVVNRGQRVPMPDEYRRYLEEMYREDIARLEQRMGGAAVSRWRSPDNAVAKGPLASA